MSEAVTDRIEKRVFLKAARARVWRALTTPKEFGTWFGVALDNVSSFRPGHRVTAPVTIEGHTHVQWDVTVEELTPEQRFSFRWHPNAIEPTREYGSEPTTLVVFELSDADGGTLLTVVESGFDAVPMDRRAQAFRGNEDGWTQQMQRIASYVDRR